MKTYGQPSEHPQAADLHPDGQAGADTPSPSLVPALFAVTSLTSMEFISLEDRLQTFCSLGKA